MGPSRAWLPDGKRLHYQHGPIDLIIEASGAPDSVDLAYRAAWRRFQTVLSELVEELPHLRMFCPPSGLGLEGAVARRMELASLPHARLGIAPMAAVAGAVADEILEAMLSATDLDRAYVNNGGDIALALTEGQRFEIVMVGNPTSPVDLGRISLGFGDPAGIATSGRHGRSHSLGIADSVTVLAKNAAAADAAATLIANAVDLPGSPLVKRVAACDLDPESDLGDRLVTVDVLPLGPDEVSRALERGTSLARTLLAAETIAAAALCLDDQIRTIGVWPDPAAQDIISTAKPTSAPRQPEIRPL